MAVKRRALCVVMIPRTLDMSHSADAWTDGGMCVNVTCWPFRGFPR